jgi:ABC-type bacteriocin/lantibiotic exporter with double-glycine peptidase domain
MRPFLILYWVLSFWSLDAGDWAPSPELQWLASTPKEVVPLVQDDDFSCGFLALSAIYESYGLDPKKARLRERLGTSVPAIPFLSSTTGTLQPDLFRVLQQDGFAAEPFHPSAKEGLGELLNHLQSGYTALALVTTKRAGGFHWVVLTDFEKGSLQIADSLVEGLHWRTLQEFRGPQFVQAILLKPGNPDPNGPLAGAHYVGGRELFRSLPFEILIVGFVLLLVLILMTWFMLRRLLPIVFRRLRNIH